MFATFLLKRRTYRKEHKDRKVKGGFETRPCSLCSMPSLWLIFLSDYRPFAFLSCANCSRKDRSNNSFTFNFIEDKFRSLAITFSIALAVIIGRPGVTWLYTLRVSSSSSTLFER